MGRRKSKGKGETKQEGGREGGWLNHLCVVAPSNHSVIFLLSCPVASQHSVHWICCHSNDNQDQHGMGGPWSQQHPPQRLRYDTLRPPHSAGTDLLPWYPDLYFILQPSLHLPLQHPPPAEGIAKSHQVAAEHNCHRFNVDSLLSL